MAFTVDWANKVVHSDASISDFPVTRGLLRALEQTEFGVVHPSIFNFTKIPLGGGAWMYDITFINGYTLQFPNSGAYSISGGNFNGTINDTGVQVVINRSAAYAVTAVGGGFVAPTAAENAAAVWSDTTALKLIKLGKNKHILNPADGTVKIYDDDGTTLLYSGLAYSDAAGTVLYNGTAAVHHTTRLT